MARDFQIAGECMVFVKQSTPSSAPGQAPVFNNLTQLGLAEGGIKVLPIFSHTDIHTDDFGPNIPAEVLWMLAEVRIEMTLVHYDPNVLQQCISESMGGATTDGTLVGAGTPMGAYQAGGFANNHYIRLNIATPVSSRPWMFPSAYLAERPIELPLSTERSKTLLRWRAIPYVGPSSSITLGPIANPEIKSAGAVIWTHTLDN